MIAHAFHQLVEYITLHPQVGLAVAFLIAFAESLPILGTIIPGSVTMTAVGTLIGAKALPLFGTLAWASLGAFCGDAIGYYLGKYGEKSVRRIWPFSRYPQWLTKGENYFHHHGGKSIIIGRFVGPVRSTIPLVAGLLKLSTPRFMLAAIPSAISWALAYTLPGILIGALSVDLDPHQATYFVIAGIAVIALLWLCFWLAFRLGKQISQLINRYIQLSWQKLKQKQHQLYHWIKRQHQPDDHHQLSLLVLTLFFFLSFCWVLVSVVSKGSLLNLNTPIHYFLQSLHTPWLTHLLIAFTLLGDKVVIFGFSLLMMLWLYWQGHRRAAKYLLAITLLSAGLIGLIKFLYYSPRPDGILHVAKSSSFPSGHTCFSLVALGFTCYLGGLLAERKWRITNYAVVTLLILLIAFSRLYLDAHWFSDILGSFTLGLTILCLSVLLHRRHLELTQPIRPWLTAILLALVIPWVTYGSLMYTRTLMDYQTQLSSETTSLHHWWQKPLQVAPSYHKNRFGHPYAPFNVQWLDTQAVITLTLKQAGWKLAKTQQGLAYTLQRMNSEHPIAHQPFIAKRYQGKPATMVFYKSTQQKDTILQLSLWPSQIKFVDNETPLWLGTLEYHRSQAGNLMHYHAQNYELKKNSISTLIRALKLLKFKIIQVNVATQPQNIANDHWDGKILVIRSH